jgi:hypothetical protein
MAGHLEAYQFAKDVKFAGQGYMRNGSMYMSCIHLEPCILIVSFSWKVKNTIRGSGSGSGSGNQSVHALIYTLSPRY